MCYFSIWYKVHHRLKFVVLGTIQFVVLNISIYVEFRAMPVQNQDKAFENFESNCFCFESVLSSDSTDPDKNFFKDKLQ